MTWIAWIVFVLVAIGVSMLIANPWVAAGWLALCIYLGYQAGYVQRKKRP